MMRDELIKQFMQLSDGEISDLKSAADIRKAAEEARVAAGRSDDPIGTIRFNDDGDPDTLWVRDSHNGWEPFFKDDHGLGIEDHDINWRQMPKVGMMPADWVTRYEEYAREDEKYQ